MIIQRILPFGIAVFLSLVSFKAGAEELSPGMQAPEFRAAMQGGQTFDLASRQGKWTVLYFYPKDATPGCTNEAKGFRDELPRIRRLGAEVYGISQDDVVSHEKFAESLKLNFPLIADDDGKVSEKYGADGVFGFSKRWTFVIGPDLKIVAIQKDVDPTSHARDIAALLEKNIAKK